MVGGTRAGATGREQSVGGELLAGALHLQPRVSGPVASAGEAPAQKLLDGDMRRSRAPGREVGGGWGSGPSTEQLPSPVSSQGPNSRVVAVGTAQAQ